MAWIAVASMALCCLGYGLWILRLVRYPMQSSAERLSIGFAIGVGLLGFFVFPIGLAGQFDGLGLHLVVTVGLIALVSARSELAVGRPSRIGWITAALLTCLGLSLGIDLLEALAPPADVDTLAYHFAIPKFFLAQGEISFIPIAVEGAVPLLTHMTYVTALGLGDERGLTLWALILELALVGTFFAVARRYVSRNWALGFALILMTTPAMIYTGGTGHLEARTALFMLVAAVALLDSIRHRHLGCALVSGIAVGFFMGSKYYGLFGATAVGVVMLLQRRPFRPFLVFSVAALIFGSPWYIWNWVNTGDPVFPALSLLLGSDTGVWGPAIDEFFSSFYAHWSAVPTTPVWFLLYPFAATLFPSPGFEAGRTGLGLVLLLAIPWVIAGVFTLRRSISPSLYRLGAITVVFYGLWFFLPTSQLTRQLLPVFPLALLVAGAIATQWSQQVGLLRPWLGAVAVCASLGLGIHALYSVNYVSHHVSAETREAFLRRNVAFSSVADWVNAHLNADDRVGNPLRPINYLLEVPYVYLAPAYQAQVELHPQAQSLVTFVEQVKQTNLSHLIVYPSLSFDRDPSFGIDYFGRALVDAGCASVEASIETYHLTSRTLGTGTSTVVDVIALNLDGEKCRRYVSQDASGEFSNG